MATEIATDWKAAALAAHRERLLDELAFGHSRLLRWGEEIANKLATLGIPAVATNARVRRETYGSVLWVDDATFGGQVDEDEGTVVVWAWGGCPACGETVASDPLRDLAHLGMLLEGFVPSFDHRLHCTDVEKPTRQDATPTERRLLDALADWLEERK